MQTVRYVQIGISVLLIHYSAFSAVLMDDEYTLLRKPALAASEAKDQGKVRENKYSFPYFSMDQGPGPSEEYRQISQKSGIVLNSVEEARRSEQLSKMSDKEKWTYFEVETVISELTTAIQQDPPAWKIICEEAEYVLNRTNQLNSSPLSLIHALLKIPIKFDEVRGEKAYDVYMLCIKKLAKKCGDARPRGGSYFDGDN